MELREFEALGLQRGDEIRVLYTCHGQPLERTGEYRGRERIDDEIYPVFNIDEMPEHRFRSVGLCRLEIKHVDEIVRANSD